MLIVTLLASSLAAGLILYCACLRVANRQLLEQVESANIALEGVRGALAAARFNAAGAEDKMARLQEANDRLANEQYQLVQLRRRQEARDARKAEHVSRRSDRRDDFRS